MLKLGKKKIGSLGEKKSRNHKASFETAKTEPRRNDQKMGHSHLFVSPIQEVKGTQCHKKWFFL